MVVRDAAGREVKRFTSEQDGTFKVDLSPGTYTLEGQSEGMFPRGSQQTVTVMGGAYTQADVRFDSGIR
ncbi:MAG: carboxypeptidase-like regulatory domain-containing protein [Actinobacteria bacterium]|nr:carboxypeptidase-like regulatory domain-containing protein [Actinomycetota bacterium]